MPLALSIAAVGLIVVGCGGRGLGLTGGSIPIGTAQVQGRAFRADDISSPVQSADVTLKAGSQLGRTQTDLDGHFAFEQIAGGTYLCTITPGSGLPLHVWSYSIHFGEGERAQLNAGLLPTTVDPASIAQVRILPEAYTLNVGGTVRFTAEAVNANGQALGIHGSLMVVGDVGDMSTDGTLRATKPGTATLVGWAGSRMTTTQVRVIP